MDWNTLKGHLLDVGKGFLGAVAAAAGVAAVNYLGAHIPDVIAWLTTFVGGVAGVKATKP